ncbi:hypothetical protein CDAR_263971 [Caerostris darwini]|uniref:Bursicon n=1 Tax=Caerostris darwini TaxID=1538125 RepID=A0AAV4TTP7_9ARAC|nr:hypothetical protein CDAR_263971 [Caerostris darwini]
MFSVSKSNRICLVALVLSLLVLESTEAKGLDCDRHCRVHRMSIGTCRCRPELFVKKSYPSRIVKSCNIPFQNCDECQERISSKSTYSGTGDETPSQIGDYGDMFCSCPVQGSDSKDEVNEFIHKTDLNLIQKFFQ